MLDCNHPLRPKPRGETVGDSNGFINSFTVTPIGTAPYQQPVLHKHPVPTVWQLEHLYLLLITSSPLLVFNSTNDLQTYLDSSSTNYHCYQGKHHFT